MLNFRSILYVMPSIKHQFLITLVLLILVSALFFYVPSLDTVTAHYFYLKGYFIKAPIFDWSTTLIAALVIATCMIATLVFLVSWLRGRKSTMIAALFIMLCFGLGPGLLVNGILKADWGRPRPHQTEYVAAGTSSYVRVWDVSDQCSHNCSFVAGDSSAALTFIAFAFLPLALRWRRVIVVLSLSYFSYNGLLRIISGSHYVSDVLIGGLLIYLVILGCYWFCYVMDRGPREGEL